MPNDDDKYSRTSYESCSAHKSAAEMSVARGKARGCNEGGNVTQVTNVTESANATFLGDPISYYNALSWDYRDKWKKACDEELETLKKFEVFEEVPQPHNHKIKWVFRMKMGSDGQIKHYKAHLVAQGFSQVESSHYNETFAPVTKFNSIQLLLALSAHFNWEIHQMDVGYMRVSSSVIILFMFHNNFSFLGIVSRFPF